MRLVNYLLIIWLYIYFLPVLLPNDTIAFLIYYLYDKKRFNRNDLIKFLIVSIYNGLPVFCFWRLYAMYERSMKSGGVMYNYCEYIGIYKIVLLLLLFLYLVIKIILCKIMFKKDLKLQLFWLLGQYVIACVFIYGIVIYIQLALFSKWFILSPLGIYAALLIYSNRKQVKKKTKKVSIYDLFDKEK